MRAGIQLAFRWVNMAAHVRRKRSRLAAPHMPSASPLPPLRRRASVRLRRRRPHDLTTRGSCRSDLEWRKTRRYESALRRRRRRRRSAR